MENSIIHGYAMQELLYENQAAAVAIWRAMDSEGQSVILKLLLEDSPSLEQLEKLEYEYELVKSLDGQGSAKVREFIRQHRANMIVLEDEAEPNCLMPVCKHGAIPRQNQVSEQELESGSQQSPAINIILKIFIEMTRAVELLHINNILHRGIHPGIFYISPDLSKACLLDFSLSRRMTMAGVKWEPQSTKGLSLLPYISPEQTGRLGRQVDHRTDLYSLGITMYELITGKRTFPSDNPLELVHCHLALTPPPPCVLNPSIPVTVSDILLKLLEKEPDLRYQSAAGLRHDLEACLLSLDRYGSVLQLKLGTRDVSNRFLLPQRLYGRETEKIILAQQYDNLVEKGRGLLLVSGSAGIGKTSIILEMIRPRAGIDCYFATGKAEQLFRNTPFYVFTHIAEDIIQQLLQEPDPVLENWRIKLIDVLDGNGQLLVELIPSISAVIGSQSEVKALEPTESRNRFLNTISSFFKLFAGREHPLTLFIDDLQWCDPASLEFIEYLMNLYDVDGLIIVGSYRDNEITENHPCYNLIQRLLQAGEIKSKAAAAPLTLTLKIGELNITSVNELLTDMLHCSKEQAMPLAVILQKKTRGNPFFLNNLLQHLYSSNIFCYNESLKAWEWDEKSLREISISESIVDFMLDRITGLSDDTQKLLKIAALIGSTFELRTVCDVGGLSLREAATALKEGVDNDIIIPENEYFDVFTSVKLNSDNYGDTFNIRFHFTHDRFQQACAVLVEEGEARNIQIQIGRSIKNRCTNSSEFLREKAISIVCHLNEGLEELIDEEERLETAKLNYWACLKAKVASAFPLALHYIYCSIKLLPLDSWNSDYDLTFEMIKTFAECAYLNNEYKLAEQQIEVLMKQVDSEMDQAEIRLMQSILYRHLGRFEESILYGIKGLSLLGVRLVLNPGFQHVFKELIFVKAMLRGKDHNELLRYKAIESKKVKLIIRIMGEINSVAYPSGRVNLFLLSTLKSLYLTLKYGYSPEAASNYSSYGILLAVLGDLKGSFRMNNLALALVEEEERAQYRAGVFFAYGFIGHAWNNSWQNVDQWFRRTLEEATRYGDHYQTALACTFMHSFKPDLNINQLIQYSMEHVPLIQLTGNEFAYYLSFLFTNRMLNYAGLTDGKFSMDVSAVTQSANGGRGLIAAEDECLSHFKESNSMSGIGVYYKEKMYIHYLFDDYEGARKYLAESDQYLRYHSGTPYVVECRFVSFLVLSSGIDKSMAFVPVMLRRRLKKEYHHMRKWAEYCPVNFMHLCYLMEAELARIDDSTDKATVLYELAVKTAAENGFMRDEALANELAGKMYLAHGLLRPAKLYLSEAQKLYRQWGAEAKAIHMSEKYGTVLDAVKQGNTPQTNDGSTELANIDLLSILAVHRALSSEVNLSELLLKILKIVVENSGAQKAYILLMNGAAWNVEAEWISGRAEVMSSVPLSKAQGLLPSSIINYCIHSGEYVVLGDASNTTAGAWNGNGRYAGDAYLQSNNVKSLFCMPVTNQGVMTGILYIENNLATDVFKADNVQLLQLLAAQFSISIKNLQLFTELLETTEELHASSEKYLRSEIAFLQAQIKPHFLYNALNTISAFSLDDAKKTRELLANLSNFLRSSFDFKNRDKLVPLKRELELVESYLSIEKARYGDRLHIVYEIEEGLDCMLPPLVIQPLVENSVQHGLSGQKRGGTVRIRAWKEEDYAVIAVEDDGVGIPREIREALLMEGEGQGVALKNIHSRLQRFFGNSLEIADREGGGTIMIVRIPLSGAKCFI